MDLSPLWISLRIMALSTVIVFFSGIAAAHCVVKLGKVWKGLADCILTLPMVLPPTVVGFFLLKLFGINGVFGRVIMELFSTRVIFTWYAAVISSTVVAFPLMYRSARGAFEQLDVNLRYSAQTLGLSNTYIFWRIVLPNCKYGIISGTVLAFARGLGEFGATIMIAGNIPGRTQTISVAVYSAMTAGNDALAYKWVLVNLSISFTVMLIMNLVNSRSAPLPRKREAG
jgi:molybdate transport system permease protein